MIKINHNVNKSQEFRSVYAETLEELMESNDKVVILDADLAGAVNTTKLFEMYPERAINVGISEANMIGISGGLSTVGLTPFVHTFAPFATRRVLDQIFMALAYSKNSTHIYGSDPGLYAQYNGGTHTTFEDLSVLRAISGITITAPSDGNAFSWVMKNYVERNGLYYTRAPRGNFKDIYSNDMIFEYGKGYVVREGKDIAIIALGTMVHEALDAAKILKEKSIDVQVIDMFFVKPYDENLIQETIKNFDRIITVENHNKYGGISDLVAREIVKSEKVVKLDVIAIDDRFGEIGNSNYLKEEYGLTSDDIVKKVLNVDE